MKILITCSGGKFIFQIIEALKSSKKKHEVIGTDTNKDTAASKNITFIDLIVLTSIFCIIHNTVYVSKWVVRLVRKPQKSISVRI